MSSIATFYLLPETGRAEFLSAHRNQKSVTHKRAFFGTKEVVTGERFLWEYLDTAATQRTAFPMSGFVIVDYLFTFVALPEPLVSALNEGAEDDPYYVITAELATSLAQFLGAHVPSLEALSAFAEESTPDPTGEYAQALLKTHDLLLDWFSRIPAGTFGVLHLTF